MMNTYLIDTNILVYAYNIDSELHQKSLNILQDALDWKTKVFIADKNLYEFYAIITDSRRVEKPVPIQEANDVVNFLKNSNIQIIFPTPKTIDILLPLLKNYKVKKQQIFDFILAAMIIENNIDTIITRNDKDFNKIKEINVFNPFDSKKK